MADRKRYHRLINNTAIIALGQIGSKVLVYLLVRLYTSVMSTAEYSVASNITETSTLLIPLISLGIAEAVFRFAMDKKYSEKDVFTSGFVVFFAGCLLFAAAIPILIAIPYFDGSEWLVVVYVIASILHSLCSQFIRAKGWFKLYAVQGLINTALTITFNIIFLIPLKMSFTGYVLSVAVADTLTMLFIVLVAKLWRYIDFRAVGGKTVRDMLRYSIPMIPTTIFWWVTNVSDRFMVTGFVGDDVNGLYTAAYKIPTLLMVLSGIFVNAWRNSAVDEKDSSDYKVFFGNVFDLFSDIIFLIAAILITFTPVITNLMFAKAYHEAWVYIPILTCAMVFFNFVSFTGSVYVVSKKTVWSFITSLAGAVLNVVMNLMLIPWLGAYGAAIATAASFVLVFILRIITTRKMVEYPVNMAKLITNTVVMAALAAVMTIRFPGWLIFEILLFVFALAVNAPPIIRATRKILASRRGKGKSDN